MSEPLKDSALVASVESHAGGAAVIIRDPAPGGGGRIATLWFYEIAYAALVAAAINEATAKHFGGGVAAPAASPAADVARLKAALRDGLELFDNYGFADESPCARDREIVANMRAAVADSCS